MTPEEATSLISNPIKQIKLEMEVENSNSSQLELPIDNLVRLDDAYLKELAI